MVNPFALLLGLSLLLFLFLNPTTAFPTTSFLPSSPTNLLSTTTVEPQTTTSDLVTPHNPHGTSHYSYIPLSTANEKNNNCIQLTRYVTQSTSESLTSTLLSLHALNANLKNPKPITLYLTAPGGEPAPCLAALRTLETVKAQGTEVRTITLGFTSGPAVLLSAGGTVGKRLAGKSTRVLLQDYGGGGGEEVEAGEIRGQTEHVKREVRERLRVDKEVAERLGGLTGRGGGARDDCRRGVYLNAVEGVAYGVFDGVLGDLEKITVD